MKLTNLLLTLALCVSMQPVVFAADEEKCEYPTQPPIPNGRKATEAELVAAQKAMKAYLAEGDAFIACITEQEESWGDEATPEQKEMIVRFNNKVVDDMQAVADLFNAAVRAYKGKN